MQRMIKSIFFMRSLKNYPKLHQRPLITQITKDYTDFPRRDLICVICLLISGIIKKNFFRVLFIFLFINLFSFSLLAQEQPLEDTEMTYEKLNQELDSLKQRLIEKAELKKVTVMYAKGMDEAKLEAKRVIFKNLLKEALGCYQKKDYSKAIELLQNALCLEPKNQKAKKYLQMAKDALGRGLIISREEEARITREGLQEARAKGIDSRLKKAQQFLDKGDFAAARDEFTKVLEISPSNTKAEEGLRLAKLALEEQGKEPEPKMAVSKKATLNERIKSALGLLEGEDYLGAQKEFLSLLEEVTKAKQDAQVKVALEETKKRIKDRSGEVFSSIAEAQFTKAEKTLLDILERIKVLAIEKQKKEEEKKREFQVVTYMEMALKYLGTEDYASAKKELNKILAIDPNNSQAITLSEKLNEVIEIVGVKQ